MKIRTILRESLFWKGFFRIIDLTGNIDRETIKKEIHSKSDKDSIENDWRNVGNDIKIAIQRYKNESTFAAK